MHRLVCILILLLMTHQGKSQHMFSNEVWKKFHKLTSLSVEEQIKGFRLLQFQCIDKKLTTDSTYTNLLFLYAGAHFANNNYKLAISLLKEAIEISIKYPKSNPKSYLSKYYFYLAFYQNGTEDISIIIKNYNNAYLYGVEQYNKWRIPSLSCQALAHIYYEIEDYQRGLMYASLGVKIDRKNADDVNLTKNIYEQCNNLFELDQMNGIDVKVDSLRLLMEHHSSKKEMGIYYKLFAKIWAKQCNYQLAEFWFKKSEKIFKELSSYTELSDIYINLHYLAILRNHFQLASYYESLALEYQNDSYNLSKLYNNKAYLFKSQSRYKDSRFYLQKSLVALPIDFEPLNPFENPSASKLKKLSQKDYAFNPLLDKAEILSLDKNNKTDLKYALNTYLLLDTLVDYIRWQHQGMGTKLFWREKLNSFYEQAIETCYQLDDTEKAFYFLEKSRAVLLLDQLNNNAAQSFLPKAEIEKESALRLQVGYYQNSEKQNDQLSDFLQAQAKLEQYVKNLEQRYPRYYEYKYNNRIPKLSVVRAYLARGQQSLFSYYEGKNGVYVLVINPKTSFLKKIDPVTYNQQRQQLVAFLSDKRLLNQQYPEYLKIANRFYQLLFAPLKPYLTSRVIIATSNAIIPFAALSVSAKQADYLVNHYAFSYTYSARALLNNLGRPSTKNEGAYFLGIAPVHFPYKSSLASLPASENALNANRKLFSSTSLLTKEEARKSSFENQWPQAKVVQLISHAYADQKSAEPAIYLADSSLSLKDISQQQVRTQLLILSACRTNVGKDYKGEGVFSLSRGFMGTGIPSIFSTLWDINDQDAYIFSHKMLSKASKQIPLDVALQKTQQEWLRKADRSRLLPNAWAGIILLGSSAALPEEPHNYRWFLYTAGISLLLGAVWWQIKNGKRI